MKTEIKAALITGILGAVATVTAAFIGSNFSEKKTVQQLYNQITTVNGNNNTVTVNSVDEFISQYNTILNENEILKAQNSQYFADYTEQKNINENLESQFIEQPNISYENIGLSIEGNDIPINKQNSIISIDGKEYYSKELAEKFLKEDQNIIIKDDTLFIGKVIADKASLFDQNILDQSNFVMENSMLDSYGNSYLNALRIRASYTGDKYIIYSLNNQYSFLRMTIAIRDNANIDSNGILVIKADDTVIYTSNDLNKSMQPFIIDVPINNCNLLTMEYSPKNKSFDSIDCIISDAIVYNYLFIYDNNILPHH